MTDHEILETLKEVNERSEKLMKRRTLWCIVVPAYKRAGLFGLFALLLWSLGMEPIEAIRWAAAPYVVLMLAYGVVGIFLFSYFELVFRETTDAIDRLEDRS